MFKVISSCFPKEYRAHLQGYRKRAEGDGKNAMQFGFLRFLRSDMNFLGLHLQNRKFDYIRKKSQE